METRHYRNFSYQKKRSRSHDGDDMDLNNTVKMRKINTDSSDNSSSNDFLGDSNLFNTHASTHLRNTPNQLKESLQNSIQYIFKIFQQFLQTDKLSLKVYFVYQFVSLLVECGQERVRLVLNLLPTNLINNLLKVMLTDQISVGLIAR